MGMAALLFPLPPHPAPFPRPQLIHALFPPPPPHPLPPAVVLHAAHAGRVPGGLSWLCREQPEPKRGRGGHQRMLGSWQHIDARAGVMFVFYTKPMKHSQSVKPAILYRRCFTLKQSSMKNPSVFFPRRKVTYGQSTTASKLPSAGNIGLNRCKQSDLIDVIKGANKVRKTEST